MSHAEDDLRHLETELHRSAAIAGTISLLVRAGDFLLQAATAEADYEHALRKAIVVNYTARIAALRNELESLADGWERVPDLEKKARRLGLLR